MSIEAILKLLTENPITASVIGTFVTFCVPVAIALRKAFIRRIDQSWPDAVDSMSDEDKVQHTVARMKERSVVPLPRGLLTTTIRKHKSIPPPDGG